MYQPIITVLLSFSFLLLFALRIRSWSLGRKALVSLSAEKPFGNMDIGFNLKTMSLSEKEISKYPENIQEVIRKKKNTDRIFFFVFIVVVVLIFIKYLNQ
ncbi:MAG: hypothetical protein Q8Q92_02395 [bacterium]|nr:hypothetical protein [bacterium]